MLQQKTYQAKQSGPHIFETKGPHAPKWYIVDASGMVVGRLATVIARVLTGKHKATYTRHADAGDFVVVINADKVAFTRNKWENKKYYRHSGWMSGLKTKTAQQMLETKPEEIIKLAVQGMMPKTALGRRMMTKLKVYASDKHPHVAQNPQSLPMAAARKTILTAPSKAS